ncbi:MAG: Thiamine-phosphate pyrophosphorylase [Rhizobacter sp.]|nr:Thiamine-phosphate pyrophosphorylase [Rhizobacter sp.]
MTHGVELQVAPGIVIASGHGGSEVPWPWRVFMVTPQARGWLSMPAGAGARLGLASASVPVPVPVAALMPADAQADALTESLSIDLQAFVAPIEKALADGFCQADAVVIGMTALARGMAAASSSSPESTASPTSLTSLTGREALPVLSSTQVPVPLAFNFPSTGPEPMGLYAIVDSADWVERVAAAGVTTVQLRIKHSDEALLGPQIEASIAAARRHGARLFINDHWRLAMRHGAYGVHLGQEDLETADLAALAHAGVRLGLSTHAPWEVARALAASPSYIACGPIHATLTKDMPWIPQGEGNLAFWSSVLPVPVVAIGGLDLARAADAAACGADGIAVLSGITQADDPEAAIRAYADAVGVGRRRARSAAPVWPRPTLPHALTR